MLSGIVPPSKWSSWWGKARKDSRLVVGSGARPECSWSDSAQEADASLVREFEKAAPRKKLEMARKNAARSPELASSMARTLAQTAAQQCENNPALALEIGLTLEHHLSASSKGKCRRTGSVDSRQKPEEKGVYDTGGNARKLAGYLL
jgi:hypothetical protein